VIYIELNVGGSELREAPTTRLCLAKTKEIDYNGNHLSIFFLANFGGYNQSVISKDEWRLSRGRHLTELQRITSVIAEK